MVFEAEYFERLHRDVYFSTQLSFTATVICITWNPPVVGKGGGGELWDESPRPSNPNPVYDKDMFILLSC